jgi:hypothetical protein
MMTNQPTAIAAVGRRGYMCCQVDRSQLQADLQVVTTVSRPDAPESALPAGPAELP